MKVTATQPSRLLLHSMFVDIELQKQLRERSRRSVVPAWEVLFFPEDFKKEHEFDSLDDWRLTDFELEKYAKLVSKMRTEVRREAIGIINS